MKEGNVYLGGKLGIFNERPIVRLKVSDQKFDGALRGPLDPVGYLVSKEVDVTIESGSDYPFTTTLVSRKQLLEKPRMSTTREALVALREMAKPLPDRMMADKAKISALAVQAAAALENRILNLLEPSSGHVRRRYETELRLLRETGLLGRVDNSNGVGYVFNYLELKND